MEVGFQVPAAYPMGKNRKSSLSRRLAGYQPGPTCCGEERNFVVTSKDIVSLLKD